MLDKGKRAGLRGWEGRYNWLLTVNSKSEKDWRRQLSKRRANRQGGDDQETVTTMNAPHGLASL